MPLLFQDVRYAVRVLRRQRGLSVVIVLTLALAIGASTAIFSIVDALLLQALPIRNPQTLYVMRWSAHHHPGFHSSSSYGDCQYARDSNCSFSWPVYQELRTHAQGLAAVTAAGGSSAYNVSGHGQASIAFGQAVAGNYFSTLGVRPAAGRLFSLDDDRPGAPLAVVLSHAYWQSAFGGAGGVIGQTIHINNLPATVIGVTEARFTSLTPGSVRDLWVTLNALPRLTPGWRADRYQADSIWLTLFGRVRPGTSLAAAQAEVSTLFRNAMLAGTKPLSKPGDAPRVELQSAQDHLQGARAQYRQSLTVLMWAVGAILLIACANIAGLLLGRSGARQREFAVRRALGAGAGRILRQLITESLLLAAAGGVLGLGLAFAAARALLAAMPSWSGLPLGLHVALDGRVLLFTVAATLVTGILFGLAPGLRSARLDLARSLKDSAGNTAAAGQRRWRWLHPGNALVVGQIALGVIVLAGAGLLVRTLANLRAVNPGFETAHVLLFDLSPSLSGYSGAAIVRINREVQQRLAALPGVDGVTYSSSPLVSGDLSATSYNLSNRPGAKEVDADTMSVGIGFFSTLRIPVLLGRDFEPADFVPEAENANAKPSPKAPAAPPRAVIVNQAFVKKYLGGGNPVGRVFGVKNNGSAGGWKIVGVVADTKYQDLRSAVAPTTFVPDSRGYSTFEVRTAAAHPLSMLPEVRQALRALDPNLPLSRPSTEARNIDMLLFRDRMMAWLSACFAGLALLLAGIGLYGLLAQEVTRRTREIGIRMALGAERGQVLGMILGQGAGLGLVGLGAGAAGAMALTGYLRSMLFGLQPGDPATLAGVGVLLLAVAVVASYLPARRATAVDPLEALRCE